MSRVFAGLIALALIAPPVFAQQTAPTAAPQKTAPPAKAKAAESKSDEQKRDEAAVQQARAQSEGQAINTRIELTITDSRGEGAPIVKTVSIMTADRSWGRIRTQGEARTASGQRFPVILNVDARPWMVRDNRAKVELTIEYRPADEISMGAIATPRRDPDSITPNINESLSVILDDGKSVLISQSADPVTDRKVKVEAKFAIVK